MKKFKYILLALFALYPALASAQLGFDRILPGGNPVDWGWETLGQTIGNVVELALILSAGVAIIFIIIGGYQYIFSFGNPEAIEHAKNTIIWAIIGLVLALSSVLIMEYVEDFVVSGTPSIDVPEATAPQAPEMDSGDASGSSEPNSPAEDSPNGNGEEETESSDDSESAENGSSEE